MRVITAFVVGLVSVMLAAVLSQMVDVVFVIVNVGVGFTVMLKFCTGPVQPALVAVTPTVIVTGEAPALIAVKEGIANGALLSDPSGSPTEAPPVHVNVSPPPVFALRLMEATLALLQATWFEVNATTGLGLIVTL
jgi:hypothetical protein